EGGEGRVEQGVAGGLAGHLSDQRLGGGALAEERSMHERLGGVHLGGEVLVLGKLLEEAEQQPHVLGARRADGGALVLLGGHHPQPPVLSGRSGEISSMV